MLPESEEWQTQELHARAETLTQALAHAQHLEGPRARVSTLPALVPYIVLGLWAWPKPLAQSHWLYQAARRREGTRVVLRCHGPSLVPGSVDDDPVTIILQGLPRQPAGSRPPFGVPVWNQGHSPSANMLYRLAKALQKLLHRLIEATEERVVVSHEILLAIEKGYHHRLIRDVMQQSYRPPALSFPLTERIGEHDFHAYCFWQVRRLLAEGHAALLGRCDHCGHVFIKTRQDPSDRPSRFCSDWCRKTWHNARRPKKGGQPSSRPT